MSPLADGAKRGADEWRADFVTRQAGGRFTLSSGERAGVRADVEPTSSANARRELEKKSGRKVVTSQNYLALAQAVKKAKRVK